MEELMSKRAIWARLMSTEIGTLDDTEIELGTQWCRKGRTDLRLRDRLVLRLVEHDEKWALPQSKHSTYSDYPGAWFTKRGDDECWTRAMVFDRDVLKAIGVETKPIPYGDAEYAMELLSELCGWYAFERGPGYAFGECPNVHVGRTRVLVTQHGGLDV
jgi:hypothetical protein